MRPDAHKRLSDTQESVLTEFLAGDISAGQLSERLGQQPGAAEVVADPALGGAAEHADSQGTLEQPAVPDDPAEPPGAWQDAAISAGSRPTARRARRRIGWALSAVAAAAAGAALGGVFASRPASAGLVKGRGPGSANRIGAVKGHSHQHPKTALSQAGAPAVSTAAPRTTTSATHSVRSTQRSGTTTTSGSASTRSTASTRATTPTRTAPTTQTAPTTTSAQTTTTAPTTTTTTPSNTTTATTTTSSTTASHGGG